MAHLCGLDIIALTDHNSCKNCPAFFAAAEKYGITPIAGMELTTSEDIHVVCLFEKLEDAMAFNNYVDGCRIKIKNRPEIFGNQSVLDMEDKLLFEEEDLLINATSISVSNVKELVENYHGVCYPAHIDRESNGIISVLGTIPEDCPFDFYELHDKEALYNLSTQYSIAESRFIISSDSHRLTDIRDKENYFELAEKSGSNDMVREQLFAILRRKKA